MLLNQKVTVVMPAYNAELTLRRTYAEIPHDIVDDVILVDDASTDDSLRILKDFADRDNRLRVESLKQNVGVHAARRVGVRRSRGEFVGYADDDDWVAPAMYAHLLKEAQCTGADIVICGADCVSEDGLPLPPKVSFPVRSVVEDNLLARFCRLEFGPGLQWNKLYRAPIIRRYSELELSRRFGDGPEDYIVNVGCFASAMRVVTVPDRHYSYLIHSQSLSNSLSKQRAFLRVFGAYVACLETYREEIPQHFPLIDELYTRQLRFDSYRVESVQDFGELADGLRDCLRRLAVVHPEALYSLVHAFDLAPQDAQHLDLFKAGLREVGRGGMLLARAFGRQLLPRRSSS